MAITSLQERVEALLSRRVAQGKARGVPAPDLEASSIFESIAFNLLLNPRSVLYVVHLARNGLLRAVREEIAMVDTLKQTVADLGNVSFAIRDTRSLSKAKNALLQLEQLDKVNSNNSAYSRYLSAVDEFLTGGLGKSIRRPGSTDLIRPGQEAESDLPTEYAQLSTLHVDVLDRLYALDTGVENFMSSPISTLLGLSTASRARADIESMLEEIATDPSASSARDHALRLIAARASIKSVSGLPRLTDPVLSATLPDGHELTAVSDPAAATVTTVDGPWVLPDLATVAVTVGSTVVPAAQFPQTDLVLNNAAHVIGSQVSFPVSVPAGTDLYVSVGSNTFRVELNTTASTISMSLSDVLAAINAELFGFAVAREFCASGSNRIILIATAADSISIEPSFQDVTTFPDTTITVPVIYNNSAHSVLGFQLGQSGTSGSTPIQTVADAFNIRFGSVLTATIEGSAIRLQSVQTSPGTIMVVTCPTELGINGSHAAVSNSLRLRGKVFGVQTDPVNPIPLLSVGDTIIAPTGTTTVASLTDTRILTTLSLASFDGVVQVDSALVKMYVALESSVRAFLDTWLKTSYARDLSELDSSVAVLLGSSTPAARNAAIADLNALRSLLVSLEASLTASDTILPTGSSNRERELVSGIITSLSERQYDKAVDLLTRLKIQELLELTSDTASYGGSLLKSMSDFVRQDVRFPNLSEDEGDGVRARQDRRNPA